MRLVRLGYFVAAASGAGLTATMANQLNQNDSDTTAATWTSGEVLTALARLTNAAATVSCELKQIIFD